jgi:hypothetical protein
VLLASFHSSQVDAAIFGFELKVASRLVRRLLNEVCVAIARGGCLHVRDGCRCSIIGCVHLHWQG